MERREPGDFDEANEPASEADGPGQSALPPPESRTWRHPSELSGGQPHVVAPASQERPIVRSRLPVALLTGTAGAFALAALLGVLLPIAAHRSTSTGRDEASLALGFPTSTIKVVASLNVAPTTATTTGVVELVAVTPSGVRHGYATVLDGAMVTTAAAVTDASRLYVTSGEGHPVDAVVVDVSREGVAVLRAASPVAAPAAIGSAADLETGDTVMVMVDDEMQKGTVQAVGDAAQLASGATLDFMLRAEMGDGVAEGAPLLDPQGAVVGLCTHDAQGDVVGIPIEFATARASGVGAGAPTGVTWLGLAGRNDDGGVVVTDVTSGGPAAGGGLAAGDRITAVNGRATPTVAKLVLRLRAHRPHDVVTFTIVRGGTVLHRQVELGSDREH